ncbi:MAG: hypothetical protein JWL61_2514, partial [Gemmatimonadetes bacterium]|nr:hypothetical protein [Gemmatimonadota bacterium]
DFSPLQSALGIAGAVLLGAGVFLPFITAPTVGDIPALWMGNGGLLLVLAVVALVLCLARAYDAVALIGVGSLFTLGMAFLRLEVGLARMISAVAGDVDLGLQRVVEESGTYVSVRWGTFVLVAGGLLLCASSRWISRRLGARTAPPAKVRPATVGAIVVLGALVLFLVPPTVRDARSIERQRGQAVARAAAQRAGLDAVPVYTPSDTTERMLRVAAREVRRIAELEMKFYEANKAFALRPQLLPGFTEVPRMYYYITPDTGLCCRQSSGPRIEIAVYTPDAGATCKPQERGAMYNSIAPGTGDFDISCQRDVRALAQSDVLPPLAFDRFFRR